MKLSRTFPRCVFSSTTLREALDVYYALPRKRGEEAAVLGREIVNGDDTWSFDETEELLGAYERGFDKASLHVTGTGADSFVIHAYDTESSPRTHVSVERDRLAEIERVLSVFSAARDAACRPPPPPEPPPPKPRPRVFIGHGGSPAWRDLKDHLHDHHGYEIEAYETGARAGHTIRDILDSMLQRSSFALLVLTAEDEQADGEFRARQNVVHETGLFQGRLGFDRAIVVLEEGVEAFSNLQGIQQIRFGQGRIREAFGDVVATLRREFPAS